MAPPTEDTSKLDMWEKKKKVYAQQLAERLEEDDFKRSFAQTADHVRAIHKLSIDFNRRRTVEQAMFTISVVSILLVFIECITEDGRVSWIRIVNTVFTALLLGLLLRRYSIEVEIAIGKGSLPADVRLWELPSSLVLTFLVEFVICGLFVPPGVTGSFKLHQWITRAQTYSNGTLYCKYYGQLDGADCFLNYTYTYQVLGLVHLARVYMAPRFVRNLSDYYSYRIAFIGSLNNVDALGTLFAIKYILRTKPFAFLTVSFVSALLTTACAIWILERDINPLVSTYANACWLTVVTMATVGYGDRVPITLPGQVVIILFAMIIGIILTGMLSASFFAMLELTDADHNVFNLLSKEKQAKTTANASARLIQAAWNLRQCRRRRVDLATYQAASVLLYATAQTCRKQRKAQPLNLPSTNDELDAHFAHVRAAVRDEFAKRKARLLALEATLDGVKL
ncbi:Aste57867_13123 [Aphanomyces stellatus]|uniref:Aste57867_13123 protein n=1 Tax=Aphanomyces stellatus TaxID=120398 RepID=A0A485KYZ8_9STRA|nr:hypothetical protein As57867_013074 [Aphanomyces stellatus]VFT89965.1 Aste57867_13123 [Aphanomyces stellatus]